MPDRATTVRIRNSGTLSVATRSSTPAAPAARPIAIPAVIPTRRASPTASAPTTPKHRPGRPVSAPAIPALMPRPSRTSSSTGPGDEAPGRRLIETRTTAVTRTAKGRADPRGRSSTSGTCTDSRQHQQRAQDEGGDDHEGGGRALPGRVSQQHPDDVVSERDDHPRDDRRGPTAYDDEGDPGEQRARQERPGGGPPAAGGQGAVVAEAADHREDADEDEIDHEPHVTDPRHG